VDGYLTEGHVPVADIRKLLQPRPKVRGIAARGCRDRYYPSHYPTPSSDTAVTGRRSPCANVELYTTDAM